MISFTWPCTHARSPPPLDAALARKVTSLVVNAGRTAPQPTPLGSAAPTACTLAVRSLGDIYKSVDEEGRTALHMAAFNGHLECVKVLSDYQNLPKGRGWWAAQDDKGRTALDYAKLRKHQASPS